MPRKKKVTVQLDDDDDKEQAELLEEAKKDVNELFGESHPDIVLQIKRKDPMSGRYLYIAQAPFEVARDCGTIEEYLKRFYGGGSYCVNAYIMQNGKRKVIATTCTDILGEPKDIKSEKKEHEGGEDMSELKSVLEDMKKELERLREENERLKQEQEKKEIDKLKEQVENVVKSYEEDKRSFREFLYTMKDEFRRALEEVKKDREETEKTMMLAKIVEAISNQSKASEEKLMTVLKEISRRDDNKMMELLLAKLTQSDNKAEMIQLINTILELSERLKEQTIPPPTGRTWADAIVEALPQVAPALTMLLNKQPGNNMQTKSLADNKQLPSQSQQKKTLY